MNTNISHQNMVQALMKALYQNNLPTITDFLNQGVNVNQPYNDNGWTPFMWVCKEFYETDVIKQFLAYGGNVHSRHTADCLLYAGAVCHGYFIGNCRRVVRRSRLKAHSAAFSVEINVNFTIFPVKFSINP